MRKINLEWMKTCAEIPTLVVFLAFTLSEAVSFNFVMFRTCYVDLGYNQSDCEKLGTGDSDNYTEILEEATQPRANVILMVQEMLTQAAPALLCLFLGPWSDKHGRRPVIMSTMGGFCLGGLTALIVVLIQSASAWWFVGVSITLAVFGGVTTFLAAVICYIADVSSRENRGMRMGIFEGLMTVGMLIGTVISSYIFDLGGYITVFVIVTSCFFLGFFYHFFFMIESLQFNEKDEQKGSKINVFSLTNLKEMVVTTFKARPNHTRSLLILTIIIATLIKFLSHADASIFYMFLRRKLNWDMEKYTLYRAIRELLRVIVCIGGVSIFHKMLKIRETPLILVGALVTCVSMILQGLASEDWHIYLAGVLRAFGGFLTPMSRSLLSKLVTQEETGQVFSLSIAVESLSLLGGLPLYTYIYDQTLSTNPGTFNYLTAGLYGALVIFSIMVLFVQKLLQKENILKMKEEKAPKEKTEDIGN